MRQDIEHLYQFYNSPLGELACSCIMKRMDSLWPNMDGCDVLGFGFCQPFLNPQALSAKRIIYACPYSLDHNTGSLELSVQAFKAANHEAAKVRKKSECLKVMTEEYYLPFAPFSFDKVLVTHGLEESPNPQRLLEELYRVTKPEGEIVIISANRSGLWMRSDISPIGAGRPFTRQQLTESLRQAKFSPTIWAGALYAPPFKRLKIGPFTKMCEKFGETVWPGFSGVIMVQAVKRFHARSSVSGADVKSRLSSFIPVKGKPSSTSSSISQEPFPHKLSPHKLFKDKIYDDKIS